jgi:glutamate--cysteine ligase catalytic subunit
MLDNAELINEFSKVYGQRTHGNECIGVPSQSIPTLEEINDMLKQEEKIQISLRRIREIVRSHHHRASAFTTEDCKRL